jgi:hypothetical protein
MCPARALMLWVTGLVAAMAVVAPAALGAPDGLSVEPELHEPVPGLQARLEPQSTLCPAVTPVASTNPAPGTAGGGCRLHVSGTGITQFAHLGGGIEVTVFTCDIEFDVRMDGDGEGWITHVELTEGATGTCLRKPCGSAAAEGRAWGFHTRESAPASERATILLCLESLNLMPPPTHEAGTDMHCEIELLFGEGTNHRQTFLTRNGPPLAGGETCHGSNPAMELSGVLNVESTLGTSGEGQAEQNVEVIHGHDGLSAEPELHAVTPKLQARLEPQNTLCPAVVPPPETNPAPLVTSGGCRLHMAAPNVTLTAHSFGIETIVFPCDFEFDVRMDADGEGWISHQEMTGPSCGRRPCAAAASEGRAWGFHTREVSAGAERMTFLLCFELGSGGGHSGGETHCELELPLTETTNHRYTLTTPSDGALCHGGGLEWSGTFSTEGALGTTGEAQSEQNVEINHV